ncbi:MAG: 50S ribosomal protein L6 [Coprobacillus sp.]|nr:50S ribosomal protein L6 [Coprobacillus sp.]
MSRVGNKHITLPAGVSIELANGVATVTGPKGTLTCPINHGIDVHIEGTDVSVTRQNETKQVKQNHGTTRANLYNAVVGVSEGFKKELEMKGIGYKAAMSGPDITLWVGFSHQVTIKPNEGVTISLKSPTDIIVEGLSKQAVGQTAARIREIKPPEPYLGKGIRYKGEVIRLKEGKRASAGKKK